MPGLWAKDHKSTSGSRLPMLSYRPEFLEAYVPGKTWYLSVQDQERRPEAGRPQGGAIPAETCARRILGQFLVDLSWFRPDRTT